MKLTMWSNARLQKIALDGDKFGMALMAIANPRSSYLDGHKFVTKTGSFLEVFKELPDMTNGGLIHIRPCIVMNDGSMLSCQNDEVTYTTKGDFVDVEVGFPEFSNPEAQKMLDPYEVEGSVYARVPFAVMDEITRICGGIAGYLDTRIKDAI